MIVGIIVKFLVIPVATFFGVTWWMTSQLGVNGTIAAMVGAAAVFGELVLVVRLPTP